MAHRTRSAWLRASVAATLAALPGCKDTPPPPTPAPMAALSPAPVAPPALTKPPPPPAARADAAVMIAAFEKAMNSANWEDALAYYADDYEQVMASQQGAVLRGKANLRAVWALSRQTFPGLQIKTRRIFDLGDTVVLQAVGVGRHTGDMQGLPPTGNAIGAQSAIVLTRAGDQWKRGIAYNNNAAVFRQIGRLKDREHPVPALPSSSEVVRGAAPQAVFAETAKRLYAALDRGDVAAAATERSPAFLWADHSEGQGPRPWGAYQEAALQLRKAFPDLKRIVEAVHGAGDYVVACVRFEGTHTGPWGSLKATGKKLVRHGLDVVRFDRGKVALIESYADPLETLVALGLAPGGSALVTSSPKK